MAKTPGNELHSNAPRQNGNSGERSWEEKVFAAFVGLRIAQLRARKNGGIGNGGQSEELQSDEFGSFEYSGEEYKRCRPAFDDEDVFVDEELYVSCDLRPDRTAPEDDGVFGNRHKGISPREWRSRTDLGSDWESDWISPDDDIFPDDV